MMQIDITFDFQSDTPVGKDPDSHSPTLRYYHQFLWSKPLPSGADFTLDASGTPYLHHKSALGEFFLASDTVIPSFQKARRVKAFAPQLPPGDLDSLNALGYTIGGMMIFPGNRIGGAMTINGARGFHHKIKDRFDLTVECIRRHYAGEASPLSDVLARYAAFFALFGDFPGYVKHFLLQDMVSSDCSTVRFSAPFDDFASSPIPGSLESYQAYRRNAMDFITARNRRILEFCRR